MSSQENVINKQSLVEGNVLTTLLKFTFPIFLSILLQITYGMADLLIVGQFSDATQVSAVAIGSQIMYIVTVFCTGLGAGTTILIGQYFGAKQQKKVTQVIGVSISIFVIVAILITFIVIFFNNKIIMLMQTPQEAFTSTKYYLFISGVGCIFLVFYNLLGSIFRGIGDAKTPLLAVMIACVLNIIIDIILIGIFEMGAEGAAIATISAQAISFFISLLLIKHKQLSFNFAIKDITFHKQTVLEILKISIPIAFQSTLITLSFLVITSIINTFGVIASAGAGIVEKLSGVIVIVPFAFMQALAAYTAQNFGAGELHRMRDALLYSIVISFVFGIISGYIAYFHGDLLIKIFTSDTAITNEAFLYLKAYAFDPIMVSMMFSFSGYFNGCGKTKFVMYQSVFGAFCLRIPLAFIFANMENTSLFYIGLATPIATNIQVIICYFYYRKLQKTCTFDKECYIDFKG